MESLYSMKEQFPPVARILYRDFSGTSKTHFSCLGYSRSLFDSDQSTLHLTNKVFFLLDLGFFLKNFPEMSRITRCVSHVHSKIRCSLLDENCTFLLYLCFRSTDFPGMSHITLLAWSINDVTLV